MPMPAPMMAASGGPAGPAVPPSSPAGPQAAPMAQPSPNQGNMQMGRVQVESAMQLLERALQAVGTTTAEGEAVLKALTALAKHFNRQKAQELVPAQILEMAHANQPSDLQQMLAQRPGAGGAQQTPQPPAQ